MEELPALPLAEDFVVMEDVMLVRNAIMVLITAIPLPTLAEPHAETQFVVMVSSMMENNATVEPSMPQLVTVAEPTVPSLFVVMVLLMPLMVNNVITVLPMEIGLHLVPPTVEMPDVPPLIPLPSLNSLLPSLLPPLDVLLNTLDLSPLLLVPRESNGTSSPLLNSPILNNSPGLLLSSMETPVDLNPSTEDKLDALPMPHLSAVTAREKPLKNVIKETSMLSSLTDADPVASDQDVVMVSMILVKSVMMVPPTVPLPLPAALLAEL
jgi:hypothetical protein